jgi:hypothetical protein
MSNNAVQAATEPLRSLAFGSISGTYAAVGTPFANPCRILMLQNFTDQQMFFSDDSTVAAGKWTLPSGGQLIIDYEANKTETGGAFAYPQGTQIYVKQASAPGSGSVYVGVTYGRNG